MEENVHKDNLGQKVIRTYEGDIAEAIEQKKTSQVSMITAEETRERATESPAKSVIVTIPEKSNSPLGKNVLKIILSVLLIGGGLIGGYYFYSISPLAMKIPTQQNPTSPTLVPAIITPDTQKTINITDESPNQIINQIKTVSSGQLAENQILELIFYRESTTTGNSSNQKPTAVRVTSSDFISQVELTPPNVLVRSLDDSWMFGIHNGTKAAPFIILKTNFFQNAFAGMLQWEQTMPDDLVTLFNIKRNITIVPPTVVSPTTASSTSTTSTTSTSSRITSFASTPPSSAFFAVRGTFIDKVIKNKDVREFKDENGNILFLYAFIDNSTIVISQEEDTLSEIIDRFEKSAYVR